MRRSFPVVPLLVLALSVSACGGGGRDAADKKSASPSATASTTTSASASPRPSGQPTGTVPGQPAPLPAGSKVALELTPADQARVPKGGCRPDRSAGLVCSADKKKGYRFQPQSVRRAGVSAVGARKLDAGGWAVDITLGPAGTKALAAVTREAAKTRQLVVVMLPRNHRVLLAAQVASPITGGNLQVSGNFTEARAQRIVKQITRTAA
ncbi:MAG: hypothetical protein JWO46_2896 [Nocardioidaceae bacterium]|nr:hypothetical protein [Nocardioidaceae bacterium]